MSNKQNTIKKHRDLQRLMCMECIRRVDFADSSSEPGCFVIVHARRDDPSIASVMAVCASCTAGMDDAGLERAADRFLTRTILPGGRRLPPIVDAAGRA